MRSYPIHLEPVLILSSNKVMFPSGLPKKKHEYNSVLPMCATCPIPHIRHPSFDSPHYICQGTDLL